jgi:A/G-specific adenine glycosylase
MLLNEEKQCEVLDIEDISGFIDTFNNEDSDINSNFTENEIILIRKNMLNYYKLNRRMLPWRGDTVDNKPAPPLEEGYGTWVSEIMLQQTRVETVISYFHNWMIKFPTIESLANSTSEEVNSMWAGLGYYRRAQQLLLGAKKIMSDYKGVLPSTTSELIKIPGIGPYTAGAISSIAFNQVAPIVDGNMYYIILIELSLTLICIILYYISYIIRIIINIS